MGVLVTGNTDYDGADLVRTCTRKKGYPSEEIARKAVTSIREANPVADVRSYGCRRCGQWHVGRTPGSVAPLREEPLGGLERVRRGKEKPPRRASYGPYHSRARRPHRPRFQPEEEE